MLVGNTDKLQRSLCFILLFLFLETLFAREITITRLIKNFRENRPTVLMKLSLISYCKVTYDNGGPIDHDIGPDMTTGPHRTTIERQ